MKRLNSKFPEEIRPSLSICSAAHKLDLEPHSRYIASFIGNLSYMHHSIFRDDSDSSCNLSYGILNLTETTVTTAVTVSYSCIIKTKLCVYVDLFIPSLRIILNRFG